MFYGNVIININFLFFRFPGASYGRPEERKKRAHTYTRGDGEIERERERAKNINHSLRGADTEIFYSICIFLCLTST